jgi:hypothetical protein
MSSVYGTIFKQKLRTAKNMLRHYWPSFLGLLLGFAFIGYRLCVVVMGGGIGVQLESQHVYYLLCACIILNGYRMFIQETPPVVVNVATLHHLYHTPYFNRILVIEHAWSLAKSLLTGMLLAGLADGFQYGLVTVWNALLLGGYLYSGVLCSWILYHGGKKTSLATGACYALSSAGLLANTYAVRGILIWGVMLWAMCWVLFRMRDLNLAKYSKDISFIDETTAAASRFNMTLMAQITAEHNANRKRSLLLYHLPLKKNNAILFKAVIETVRAGNSIWTILIGLVILGALVFRTPLFAGLPFIGDPIVAAPISVLLVMTAYANICEMLKKQLSTLLQKHRQGLFLPIGRGQIVMSYALLGSVTYTAASVLTGLLMASKGLFVLVFCVLYSIVFSLDVFVEARNTRFTRPISNVLRVVSIALGFLLVS